MTANQIAAYSARETSRHYKRSDEEAARANRAKEAENFRHNTATETLTKEQLAIQQALGNQQNTINEQHYARLDAESQRHNEAVEHETNRTNVVKEGLTGYSNETNRMLAGYQGVHVANEGSYWSDLVDLGYARLPYEALNAASNQMNANASQKQADVAQQKQTTYDKSVNWNVAREAALLPYQQQQYQEQTGLLHQQTLTEPVKRGTSVVSATSQLINAGFNALGTITDVSKTALSFTKGGILYAK